MVSDLRSVIVTSFLAKAERVHHDGLIDFAVGVVAADVSKNEDPAVFGLHRAGIISRAWHVEDSGATRANLADAGWTIRSRPPGFRMVAQLMRTMGGTGRVGHIVLSDGLAAISVFIEPANGKRPAPQQGLVRQGAINVYMRPLGDYWVTAVGEAPAESVKYVANAVEHRK